MQGFRAFALLLYSLGSVACGAGADSAAANNDKARLGFGMAAVGSLLMPAVAELAKDTRREVNALGKCMAACAHSLHATAEPAELGVQTGPHPHTGAPTDTLACLGRCMFWFCSRSLACSSNSIPRVIHGRIGQFKRLPRFLTFSSRNLPCKRFADPPTPRSTKLTAVHHLCVYLVPFYESTEPNSNPNWAVPFCMIKRAKAGKTVDKLQVKPEMQASSKHAPSRVHH